MTMYHSAKGANEFKLIEPIDESLAELFDVHPGMPKGAVIDRIKEYLCRRGKKCSLCGKSRHRRELKIDRRKPVSHGGKDNIENLQLLCYRCSALKGNSTMLEMRKTLRMKKKEKMNKKIH